MKKLIKRYIPVIITCALMAGFTCINRRLGTKAFISTGVLVRQMLLLLPPVFILLGLLDVWVPREIMVKYMGKGSGIGGIFLSILLGSCTSGPLYAAFPVTAVFMKKGVTFTNIMIFLGAWSTTKIPMLLFEGSNLGWKFALTRLFTDIPGIIIIAFTLKKIISADEIQKLYDSAEQSLENA